jgi:hypothetical protein
MTTVAKFRIDVVRLNQWLRGVCIAAATLLTACSGGGGGGESANPPPPSSGGGSSGFTYSGPAPSSPDVVRFQQNFYNNLVADNRCGSCHTRGGTGTGAFVDRADVNVAHSAALPLVNLENPAASAIVAKVGGGHNCWESSNAACRVQLTSYIEAWANSAGSTAATVRLQQPTDRDPNGNGSGFRSFPATAPAEYAGVHNLLTTHCSNCHRADAPTSQQPYFAAADIQVSYAAAQSKIDLNTSSKSRLVVRLRDEHHNCWSASCANDASAMQAAIDTLAGAIAPRVLDVNAHRSAAQVLNDGTIGSSGGRFEQYQIGLWQFKEGTGNVVSDTSGVSPALNLTIDGSEGEGQDYQWFSGWGMQFYGRGGVARGSVSGSRKLYDVIAQGGEYTIETWVAPGNVTQEGPAEIVSYSDGSGRNNFLLGQSLYNYDFLQRSSTTDLAGRPALSTADADERAQAALQHVVVTYDSQNRRRIYVNGEDTGDRDATPAGSLAADWSTDHIFMIGNNLGHNRAWAGVVRMVSVHNRALSLTQIQQNYSKGVGEKRYLMFNVSRIAGMPSACVNGATDYCYVVFEVSQFDNYAYLFNRPIFISLDPNLNIADLAGLTIKGIRIGINGQLAQAGQAYVAVNATISSGDYLPGNTPESGQVLSERGTVIARENGGDVDLFYLEFDQIGGATDRSSNFIPSPVPTFTYALNGATWNGIDVINQGWRLFDAVNLGFAELTGVPAAANDAASARLLDQIFASTRQSLPMAADYQGFLAGHQTNIAQLAIGYCHELMTTQPLRNAFFTSNNTPADFRSNWRANLIDPLVNRFIGATAIASQPTASSVGNELEALITGNAAGRNPGLATACGGACSDARTLQIATAACAGALGSTAITAQ